MEGGLAMGLGLNVRQNAAVGHKQEEGLVPTLPQLMKEKTAWAMLRIPENAM